MNTKQIVGLLLSLLGGGGTIYFGMAVNNAFKGNRFWGGGWRVVSYPTAEIAFTVILAALLIVGIILITQGGKEKGQ